MAPARRQEPPVSMSSGTVAGMLVWIPINSGAPSRDICSVTAFPQSPPCATNRVYPRRFINTIHARAMRMGSQPSSVGLPGKSVARQRRNHDIESVRCAPAMCRGIRQRIDDLQLLDDRAGPSVRDDHRQRIRMLRTHVNEVNVDPIDLGDELRQSVELRLALAPVVLGPPVAREFLNRRELHALRLIRDDLPLGPPCRRDAAFQVGERLVRKMNAEGADGVGAALRLRLC